MLAKNRIEEIGKLVNDHIDEFDNELFTKLVEHIVIRNRYDLEFHFKTGTIIRTRASEE